MTAPAPALIELALRAGANATTANKSKKLPDEVKSDAIERMGQLVAGSTTANNTQLTLAVAAIELAVRVVETAYGAVIDQLNDLKNVRQNFNQECKAGIATFILHRNNMKVSDEEALIQSFRQLIQRTPQLVRYISYFGMQVDQIPDQPDKDFLVVLPYYLMSQALGQPIASPDPRSRQIMAINLLFKSALPKIIDAIDEDFQTDKPFIEFFKHMGKKSNYLNDFRSKRFILICLANLLWNLQHPIDPVTGYPLSTDEAISLCMDVGIFLNEFLNGEEERTRRTTEAHQKDVMRIIRQIEMHAESLHEAYKEQMLYELNIDDIVTSAHRTLRIMDTSLFALIYNTVDDNDVARSDTHAAEDLVYTVSYLNELLKSNPTILRVFQQNNLPEISTDFKNIPSTTVIDILINFIHYTKEQKHTLIKALKSSQALGLKDFAHALKNFNTRYLLPVEAIVEEELGSDLLHSRATEIATQTARWVVPLITLVVEDFRIDITTVARQPQAVNNANNPIIRGRDQVTGINNLAKRDDGYYQWALAPFITISDDSEAQLNRLPHYQYRFTEITKLLDAVSEIIKNYRNFLQLKSFQEFLIDCVRRVREEYKILEQQIEDIGRRLSNDETITRDMHGVLAPMTRDLMASLNSFDSAAANFEHIVSAPDFTTQQKRMLEEKLEALQHQFGELFNGDNPLLLDAIHRDLDNATQGMAPSSSFSAADMDENTALNSRSAIALRNLVHCCYESLSLQSQVSHKGKLLLSLLSVVENQEHLNPNQTKFILKELARITLGYRSTWFFQAAYGETRSAKVLIEAIRNKELNEILPIGRLLFNSSVDLCDQTPEQILQRFKSLRTANNWEEAAENMAPVATLG